MGISVKRQNRKDGVGKILLQKVLDQVKILIPQLRILKLSVYEPNTIARRLYEALGFVEYGRLEKKEQYIETNLRQKFSCEKTLGFRYKKNWNKIWKQ